jgi:DNA-binding CsgD family transcriptional regulator
MGSSLAMLTDLPPRQREAITLRYSDVSEPETARRLQISTRRVRYLVSAARRRLAVAGHEVKPLPVGRPKYSTETGSMNFDSI